MVLLHCAIAKRQPAGASRRADRRVQALPATCQLARAGCARAARGCAPPANRPSPAEREQCLQWSVREMGLLGAVRVIVCLGAFAWDAALRLRAQLACAGSAPPRPRPRFAHGAELSGERYTLIGCYHPSQQNTFTGRLTEPMIDAVLERALVLAQEPQ